MVVLLQSLPLSSHHLLSVLCRLIFCLCQNSLPFFYNLEPIWKIQDDLLVPRSFMLAALCPNKETVIVPGIRTWAYLFRGISSRGKGMLLPLEMVCEETGEGKWRYGCIDMGVGGSEARRVLTWKPQISLGSRTKVICSRKGPALSAGGKWSMKAVDVGEKLSKNR